MAQTADMPLEVPAGATAPITSAQAKRSKLELQRMRGSLASWLKYRRINDAVAAGQPVPAPLLKRPGARRSPTAELMAALHSQRAAHESVLAMQLHQLLSEVFDPQSLPDPDVGKRPTAAVELAEIAIAGKLPGEKTVTPTAQGFIWLWPLVVVVGAIAFVITSSIRSSADVAKEKERLECIKQGACTDTGFWVKLGAVAFVGWIVWDKMGVGAKIMGRRRRNPGRRRLRA